MQGRHSASKKLSPASKRAVTRPGEPAPLDVKLDRILISTPEDDTFASQYAGRADGTPEPCAKAGPAAPASPAASDVEKCEPAILIDIDPSIAGSVVHDRFDILIRGRALSPAALKEISLRVGDRIMATALFGEPEGAIDDTPPDGTPGRQRGFQFNLPLQNGGKPELSTFQIVARTVDGFDHAEAFAIELDPTALRPLSVVLGPTRSSSLSSVRPNTMIHIERGAMDNEGNLLVEGWALSLEAISAVQLFIGRQRISAARLGGHREDVAAAYGGYPDARLSGFSLTLLVEEEDRQAAMIRAQLICATGFIHEEAIPIERIDRRLRSWVIPRAEVQAIEPTAAAYPAPPTRLEPSGEIRMFCDEAALRSDGSLCISGWAVCAAGIAQVRVLLDEQDIGLAVFGYERSDVGTVYPAIPMARWSGFRFDRHLGQQFEGEHIIRVVVRGAHASKKDESLLVVAIPAVATATLAAPSFGL